MDSGPYRISRFMDAPVRLIQLSTSKNTALHGCAFPEFITHFLTEVKILSKIMKRGKNYQLPQNPSFFSINHHEGKVRDKHVLTSLQKMYSIISNKVKTSVLV